MVKLVVIKTSHGIIFSLFHNVYTKNVNVCLHNFNIILTANVSPNLICHCPSTSACASFSSTLSAVRLYWQAFRASRRSIVRASAPRCILHSFNISTTVSSISVGCLFEMDSSLTSLRPSLRPSLRQFFGRFSAITSVAILSRSKKKRQDMRRKKKKCYVYILKFYDMKF